jgi:hypothetical protein
MAIEKAREIIQENLPIALVIEEEQIERVALPLVKRGEIIPFALLLDADGHVHIEYNHSVFNPKNEPYRFFKKIYWLFFPQAYFLHLAPMIIEGSLLYDERQLIGGASCHYYQADDEIYVQFWAALTKEQLRKRCIELEKRRGMGLHIAEVLHRFCNRLGVHYATATSSVPYLVNQISKVYGWKVQVSLTWRERLRLFWSTFPVSLWHRETSFRKDFWE